MSDPRGFLRFEREKTPYRQVEVRRRDWLYIGEAPDEDRSIRQASRCMDCGVPFCQSPTYGCPVQNLIPEWNALVSSGQWVSALDRLHATNNFPEFTGFLCPAPCESACVLNRSKSPVAIRDIELQIIERGFAEGLVQPRPPRRELAQKVAVVGSGPAGLAAAQQLRRLGYGVTVYDKSSRAGGLLRYGIPDFKMAKAVVDRRLAQLVAEGIDFQLGVEIGAQFSLANLRGRYDAVVLAIGAETARAPVLPGLELAGVHLAMDYLCQQNRALSGEGPAPLIHAAGKRVAVIGGGDTGSDCIGTAIRQGAAHVYELAWNEQPPLERSPSTPWPVWPLMLKNSHAHEEGVERRWSIAATSLSGEGGRVQRLNAVRLDQPGVNRNALPPAGDFHLDVDLVILAIGFTGVHRGFAAQTPELTLTPSGAFAAAADFSTSLPGVYVAGDAKRGASLIVWAIAEGRQAAAAVVRYLKAKELPVSDGGQQISS